MGRKERKRYENNDHCWQLVEESKTRDLTAEEIDEIRAKYTGAGGLVSNGWSNGQFFTPPEVTRMVIDMLQIPPDSRILEPSCGGGAFVSATPDGCQVVGIEMMHTTSRVASLINPQAMIHQGDALEMLPELEGQQFDYCIGNPPFMAIKQRPAYQGFDIAPKTGRSEWYFIEMGLRCLKPGGVLAYVVPDGILSAERDKHCRKWMLENYWVRGIVSLPNETFSKVGTTVKTSIMIVQKPFEGVELQGKDYQVFMGIVSKIGWDSRGLNTESEIPLIMNEWRNMYPLGIGPYTPLILTDNDTIDSLMGKCGEMVGSDEVVENLNTDITHEQSPAPPVQTNVVEMSTYREKRKTKEKECPQMAFDFESRSSFL